jgi:hypothetical protein
VTQWHDAFTDNNVTSPATSTQFGPFSLSHFCSKLLRVRTSFSIGFEASVIGTSDYIVQGTQWGTQIGDFGYMPAVLPAELGDSPFLWSELIASDAVGGASYGPSSSTGVWAGWLTSERTWRGQRLLQTDQQIYVTAGSVFTGPIPWVAVCTCEVDYTD